MVLSRTDNVRGAFAVREPEAIRGRSVLLIDDVFTTGATARTCAKLLKDAGARSVALLVACES
jgi:predicted amidophosphoribosyltransferase